jgi:RNA polymerase sigma-70 factor (ECF subfamily)
MTNLLKSVPLASTHVTEQLRSLEFAELRPRLIRHARLLVRDTSVAEDLVQETLLAVFIQRQQHSGDANLNTWATAILRNKVADWYRSPERKRMIAIEDDAQDSGNALEDLFNEQGEHAAPVQAWQQPDAALERQQLKQVLDQCVERLAGLQATAFMMREWLGFDANEVAERLGISAENCRMLLHRSRLSLRGCLQLRWYGKVGV